MPSKKHKPEEIIGKLREVEIVLALDGEPETGRADIRIIQTLLGHAQLDNAAFYAKVATRTIRAVTSPLDKLAMFVPEPGAPDG
jgi:hypothetical protein